MLEIINEKAVKHLSGPGGMITLDESDFPKKGKESVGVARQYCGNTGKIDNCQAGIFLGYSSIQGYTLLEKELFLPKVWFTEEYKERREKTKIPEGTIFRDKLNIAYDMIRKKIKSSLFEVRWVGVDSTFGISNDFRKKITDLGVYCFADVKKNTLVFPQLTKTEIPPYKGRGRKPHKEQVCQGEPEAQYVETIINTSKPDEWLTVKISKGANGPIYADVFLKRVYISEGNLPGDEVWLFARREINDKKIRYSLVIAPADIDKNEIIQASALRWPIEQCFQIGKEYLGMDQYENRSFIAWHRHMTYVFAAFVFLLILQKSLKKNSTHSVTPNPETHCSKF
jgi:SRSO17 transposase